MDPVSADDHLDSEHLEPYPHGVLLTTQYDPLLDPGAFLVVLEYSGLNNITVEVVAGDAGNCTLPPDIALGTMGLSRINLVSVPSLKNNWSSRVLAQSPFVQVTPYSRVYPSLTSASEASSASETAPASSTAPPPASGITGKNNKTKTTKTRKTKTLVPMPMGHNV